MEKEFNLSEKIGIANEFIPKADLEFIYVNEIKEFIKRLKELINKYECDECCIQGLAIEGIDKLAGSKLI